MKQINNKTDNGPVMNIAHFDAKGLLYLWFSSFLFLLVLGIIGFVYLLNRIG